MAPTLPKATTLLSWFFYLIPVYLFILAPLFQFLFPEWGSPRAGNELGGRGGYDYEHGYNYEDGVDNGYGYGYDDDDTVPLHLTDDRFISPEDDVPFTCPEQEGRYKVHIFSRVPLVIYIEGFLGQEEADHLVRVSEGKYAPSIIYDGISERVDPSVRRSDRALLDRDDVVRCLEERARSFQGWRPGLYIERMWAQRYNVSGHYQNHYDWTGNLHAGGDRVSTFMVYLQADCTGGGTNFPRMKMPREKKWCQFLECDEDDKKGRDQTTKKLEGVTFKPIKGNAIFWENLRADGTGYPETWHAALPVTSGSKVGLNIWSWYQPPRKTKGKNRG